MLAPGAAERNHQTLEAAGLIIADAGIHKREDTGEKLMHAVLLIEIVDHRGVLAGESLEAFLASGIREAAAIENEASAISGFVLWETLVKGKAENPHNEVLGVRSQALQLRDASMLWKALIRVGRAMGSWTW